MNVNAIANKFSVIQALQHRDFLLYWTGNFSSVIGQQISITVQAWLIFELTGSALQLGLLGLARAAPATVLGLLGGIAADKFSQRKLLTITIAIVGVLWTIFGILIFLGPFRSGRCWGWSLP